MRACVLHRVRTSVLHRVRTSVLHRVRTSVLHRVRTSVLHRVRTSVLHRVRTSVLHRVADTCKHVRTGMQNSVEECQLFTFTINTSTQQHGVSKSIEPGTYTVLHTESSI